MRVVLADDELALKAAAVAGRRSETERERERHATVDVQLGRDALDSEWLVAIRRDGEDGDIRSASGSLSRRASQSREHRAGRGHCA